MERIYYEQVDIRIVPIDESVMQKPCTNQADPIILELLEYISQFPLKKQIVFVCNLLTISGYKEKEIAEALGMTYKNYRNILWMNRKTIKDKASSSL